MLTIVLYLCIVLNCIYAASVIVTLSQRPSGAPDGRWLRVTRPDTASIQFNLLMMSN